MTTILEYSPQKDRELLLDQMRQTIKQRGFPLTEAVGISIWTHNLGELKKITADVFAEGVLHHLGKGTHVESAIVTKDRLLALAQYAPKKDAERLQNLFNEDRHWGGDKVFRIVILERGGFFIGRISKEMIDL